MRVAKSTLLSVDQVKKIDFIGSLKLVINLSTPVLSVCVLLLFAEEKKTVLKSHFILKKRINFWSKNVPNFHSKLPTAQIEHKLHSALK